ncbi:MAG: DUF1566 domain-containing protein [Campylobacterota bacterium]
MKTLAPRTQIEDYLVEEIVDSYDDKVTYKVEDFKLDKTVLLSEYDISKRALYEKLLLFNHTNIISVDKMFEYNQKLYTVSKLSTDLKLKKYLLSNSISESEINRTLDSILDMMLELKQLNLSLNLNIDNLLITKEKNIIVNNSIDIISYTDDEQMIKQLGLLAHFLITKGQHQEIKELKPNQKYSKALCGLVNRMLDVDSNEKFKTLQELKSLVKQGVKYNVDSCEPIACEESSNNPISKMFSFISIMLIVTLGLYVIFSPKRTLTTNKIGYMEVVQFHIAGYLDNSKAQYALGEVYEKGYPVDVDFQEALIWYEKAAKNGSARAQQYLAYLYQKGKTLPKDIHKSIYWYEKALKNGGENLNYILGILYLNSDSKAIDYKKSFDYFYKSLDSNNSNSEYAVAYMYYNGFGVQKDIEKAKLFYEKAAAKGNKLAIKVLKNLNKKPKNRYVEKKLKQKVLTTKKIEKAYVEPKSISYGHFIDRGEFVEDTQTGLFWQKDGSQSGFLNFYQAKEYAKNLTLGGVKGWRVPTVKELATIFPAVKQPFINSLYDMQEYNHGKYRNTAYWSSELDNSMRDYAYLYHWYGDGGRNNCYASRNYVYVRCVHD